MAAPHTSTERQLLAGVLSQTDQCIEWPHSKNSKGYGVICISCERVYVHRFACQFVHGNPPTPQHQAAHACGNRSCFNPRHLRWATQQENDADKLVHGTQPFGDAHHSTKLSDAQIREIRSLYSGRRGQQTELARQFGVNPAYVSTLVRGLRRPERDVQIASAA